MQLPIFHIDAFTRTMFSGNPAAVVILDATRDMARDVAAFARDARWMQAVAAEMNLAETAFVAPREDGEWDLRWFTPTVEVRLCGHATLASAHALWSTQRLDRDATASFHTRQSGVLQATNAPDPSHGPGKIELALPMLAAAAAPIPDIALRAFGLNAASIVFSGHHPFEYRLIVLDSEAAVRKLTPDFALLRDRDESYAVTAPSDDPAFDFVSRYFAPGHGIDEDPVTGSAHCVYAPYWSQRLDKAVVVGCQISARTGVVECEQAGDQVLLRGHAVTVMAGALEV